MNYRTAHIRHHLFVIFIGLSVSKAESKFTPNGVDMRGYIVNVGEQSPDFKLEFPDGSSTSLEKLMGNVVMLQFTASWCSVCRDEMPHIESDIWKRYQKAGLRVIGIDLDEPPETVLKFAQEMKISYPLAVDSGATVFHKFAEKNAGVTRNIILNPNGKIIFLTRLFDPAEFREMISVIHKELEKKNDRDIATLEKEIKSLRSKDRAGARAMDSKLYLSKLSLKKKIQTKNYLDRINRF